MTADGTDPIATVLEDTRRIAVVGASANPARPSHRVVRTLIDAGYEVIPVNPRYDEVLGRPAVDRLAEIEGPIDLVDVFRRSEQLPGVVREAIAVGARAVWLQLGLRSEEARRLATDAGLRYVEDAGLGVEVDAARHRHDPDVTDAAAS